jgi:hypothetical protein
MIDTDETALFNQLGVRMLRSGLAIWTSDRNFFNKDHKPWILE